MLFKRRFLNGIFEKYIILNIFPVRPFVIKYIPRLGRSSNNFFPEKRIFT